MVDRYECIGGEFCKLSVGDGFVFTKELPVKWYCAASKNGQNCEIRFSLVDCDPGILKCFTQTMVLIRLSYFEEETGPLLPELTKEVLTYDVNDPNQVHIINTRIEPKWTFMDALTIIFKVEATDKRVFSYAGYDFTEENAANHQILVVDSKKFHVNKAVLTAYSPVFHNLFNNQNSDKAKKNEIELEDLDANEFGVLLKIIYPTNVTVNAENAVFLWKLADRFEITSVIQMCENFYCNADIKRTGKMSLANRTNVAELYQSKMLLSILSEDMEKLSFNHL